MIETDRLIIRPLSLDDAPFVVTLLNDPLFIKNIGDRLVRTPEDAVTYIRSGPMKSHEENGFGLDCVVEKKTGRAVGTCGLLKRDVLDDVDVGYAFLPQFRSKGYAKEAVRAVISHAKDDLHLPQLAAIVNPDNQPSIQLLTDFGFQYDKMVRLSEDSKEIKLFMRRLI